MMKASFPNPRRKENTQKRNWEIKTPTRVPGSPVGCLKKEVVQELDCTLLHKAQALKVRTHVVYKCLYLLQLGI